MKRAITVVGSINQDLVVAADRVPGPGETLFGERFALNPGGKGANQAVALARLGVETAMLGCVGSDTFGRDLLQALTTAGVHTGMVATVPGASGVALVQVEAHGENRITVIAGANAALQPEHLRQHARSLAASSMILTQLETPMDLTLALARQCRTTGVPLMLDPAPAAPLSSELLEAVTWLTPNLNEAQALLQSGESPTTPREAMGMAERLLLQGAQGVLLKLGSMGAVTAQRGATTLFQPAFRVPVQDTTAAGDACNAAFAAALTRGETVAASLRFACAASAVCVTRDGAQQAMPTRDEVEALLQQASA
ncbi:ribokinase [Terriglobus aquaticus]|uniref:Ribokinase n=1 Tax=Terriglobus aquaticus TaxID=940139 RepID=A0ABW9KIK8_9BACT|nr:ribokinase [Terriglobus aquaticus]